MITDGVWRRAAGQVKQRMARVARRVLPDATVCLCHVEPGLALRVNLRRNVMFWSSGLARFEPECVRVLRAAARPGGICFDVGANVGFFATLLARWVGPAGKVLAIEPDQDNVSLLEKNILENGIDNVTICDCALGSRRSMADFSVDRATGATGHLGRSMTAGERRVGSQRVEIVKTRVETLDDLVEDFDAVPDLIKLDIEGGEFPALEGSVRTLARARPVIVSELTGGEGCRVIELLRDLHYQLWDLELGETVDVDSRPFMIVGLADEELGSERSKRVQAALLGDNEGVS